MTRHPRDDGFTLIELMVVVMIIAVLLGIAIPSFLSFRSRSQDRAAQASLATAERIVRVVGLENDGMPNNAALAVILPGIEPSLNWIGHLTDSTNPKEVSYDEDDGGTEVALAARSLSGTCFYLRVSTTGPSVRHHVTAAATCQSHDFQDGAGVDW